MSLWQRIPSIGERTREDHGESPVSLVMVAPLIGMLILAAIGAGRLAEAQTAVETAVGSAAREASLALNPGAAAAAAQQTVHRTLDQRGVKCPPSVSVEAGALLNAPGREGEATVTVQCTVQLSDLLVPGLPGSIHIDRQAVSPVDTHRFRG